MRSLKEIDDEIKMIEHQKNLDEENHFFLLLPSAYSKSYQATKRKRRNSCVYQGEHFI
jgi:hypothetical protein|nr:MAG TPA: hypothetical protein [Caudoviricetes sp.]